MTTTKKTVHSPHSPRFNATQIRQHSDTLVKKQTLNVCLMWHSVYLANMGVNALTYATLRYLEEVAEQLNICFAYTILGYGITGDRDGCTDEIVISGRGIPFKLERVSLPWTDVRRVNGWLRFLKWLVSKCRPFIASLSRYDLILDISGGDCFTDIYGSARFIQMFLSKMLALAAGKTLALLPQTIGPFDHAKSRCIANQLMRRIRHIYPRDQASLHYLEQVIHNRVFHEYLDVAFHLPYERVHFTPEKIHVGLNTSGLLWQGGYTQDNMFKLRVNYRQVMRDIIQFFLEKEDVLVHLVPHVVSHDYLSQEDDYVVAEQIHRDMPETVLAPAFENPIEAKNYISGLDFFAGARMHSCIAAYSSGVPVVPMAYSRKFSGLFLSSLNYPTLADMRHDSEDQVRQKVCAGFENRTALRQAILAKRSMIENDIAAFRHELVTIVGEVCESQIA